MLGTVQSTEDINADIIQHLPLSCSHSGDSNVRDANSYYLVGENEINHTVPYVFNYEL